MQARKILRQRVQGITAQVQDLQRFRQVVDIVGEGGEPGASQGEALHALQGASAQLLQSVQAMDACCVPYPEGMRLLEGAPLYMP